MADVLAHSPNCAKRDALASRMEKSMAGLTAVSGVCEGADGCAACCGTRRRNAVKRAQNGVESDFSIGGRS